ncbi:hypothetical protein FQN49_004490 [Arthroderma sp. PD_2]|nr:hypothetical protein FQN49_004490 [Arthroderma sp. PD_2]
MARVGLPNDRVRGDPLVCDEDSDNTPEPMQKDMRKHALVDTRDLDNDTLNWTSIDEWISEVQIPLFEGNLVEALLALPSAEQEDSQSDATFPTTPDSTTNMGTPNVPDTMVHEAWAILHHSTLEREDQYPLLSQAIGLVGRQPQSNHEQNRLMKVLMAHLVAAPMSPETAQWAAQGTDIVISAMRRMGMFSGRWIPPESTREYRWICDEEIKRMAYAVLRLDVYFGIIAHRPPSLRFQELRLALPATEALWKASKTEERHCLQWFEPAGRDRCVFQSAVKDFWQPSDGVAMDDQMRPYSGSDSHLTLCAIQAELWSTSQAAREDPDGSIEFPSLTQPPDILNLRSSHLIRCQAYLEHAYRGGQICFAESPQSQHFWRALNLTLYHLTLLNLHADISLLEQQSCCDPWKIVETHRAVRTWVNSTDGRKAVYHAVQLQQKYECEMCAAWPEYYHNWNPLRPTALLYSCIVLCAYSAEHPSAPSKSYMPVELTCEGDRSAEQIQRWIQEGGCASIRGAILGKSGNSQLVSWSRERLAPFYTSSRRFEKFLFRLGSH